MKKISYLILTLLLLAHCSIDTKSGLWENKNTAHNEKKILDINFDEESTFNDFKKNVVLFGKKSNYPNIMEK